jgi:hypothetical protein
MYPPKCPLDPRSLGSHDAPLRAQAERMALPWDLAWRLHRRIRSSFDMFRGSHLHTPIQPPYNLPPFASLNADEHLDAKNAEPPSSRVGNRCSLRIAFFLTLVCTLVYTLAISNFQTFKLSYFHTFILSYFHTFIILYFRTFILLYFHTFMLSCVHAFIIHFFTFKRFTQALHDDRGHYQVWGGATPSPSPC